MIGIRGLLTSVTPWLLALLIGVAVYQGMRAMQLEAERDQTQARAERAELRAEALQRGIEWQREQMAATREALIIRDEQLAAITREIRASQADLDNLERTDAATADWSDQPVPDAVRSWVRDLPATGAGGPEPDDP